MYDRIFVKIEYDYGWCSPIKIELFNTIYDITCVASAYKNETINRNQRSKYTLFKESEKETLVKVENKVKEYVEQNFPDYLKKIKESLVPKELIFQQNGDVGILFDCEWDVETGIVVGIFPEIKIINPDNFL
ncbi:hypothetical protein [Fusobacterium sp.]|uniref:DUF6985 domain-containing protein n=1 Tax=Fusobacterium sp. TaxID=68766 RepID=UPI00262AE090|nr:hypothetical protein [Fusobacterium sp.]